MDARRELYLQYGSAMFGVVRRYVKDRQAAEDIVHDGFVTLFTRIGDYRGSGRFEAWCRRIFVNAAISYLRRRKPVADIDDRGNPAMEPAVPPAAVDELSVAEIMECMDALPEGYRTVFNLHAVEDYDYAEIADMLGVAVATVRSQYMRARGRLMELLSQRRDAGLPGASCGTDGERETKR